MKKKRALVVGLIGHNFMGKAHSNAWRQAPRFFDLPLPIRMKTLCGRNSAAVERLAPTLGWETACADWRRVIDDDEIDVIDICTPNSSHAEIAIAAARAGKALLCEKPLAASLRDAKRMVDAVADSRVTNMVCHNYRRIPAVALAKEMIREGRIGDRIFHYRARYAQDWIADPKFPIVWRLQAETAGSGANGDINSHIIDLGRFLVGEFSEISALTETFVERRPLRRGKARGAPERERQGTVTVDDAVAMIGRFQNGAIATLEATRFAYGRKNGLLFEINGSKGSLAFDLEEMNSLRFYDAADPERTRGFRDIIVTEPVHPYVGQWWPPGHLIGYEHTFVHTIADFATAAAKRRSIEPSFADGLETQKVLDAAERSGRTRRWVTL